MPFKFIFYFQQKKKLHNIYIVGSFGIDVLALEFYSIYLHCENERYSENLFMNSVVGFLPTMMRYHVCLSK